MADDEATRVIHRREEFGDTYAEVSAWRVPASDRYPDGVKYRMQYGYKTEPSAETSRPDGTIVRYDNFPDHPGAPRHHKHTPDGAVDAVDFTGLRSLFERFKTEVANEYDEPWD